MNGKRKRKRGFAAAGATEEVKTEFSLAVAEKAGKGLLRKLKMEINTGQAQHLGLSLSVKAASLLVSDLKRTTGAPFGESYLF